MVNNWFYSIGRFIVLCLVLALVLFFFSFLFSFFSLFPYVILVISLPCNSPCMCLFVCLFVWMCLCNLRFLSRCFGLLLSPGKNVKNSDMHLLDLVGDCFCVCLRVSLCVCVSLLTSFNLCPFRSQWERAQTGSLTSSREVGTPTRLSSRLWMRKRPKVTAKNLSRSLIKQNNFQQLLFPWHLAFHSYTHSNIWHISRCKNHFPLVT